MVIDEYESGEKQKFTEKIKNSIKRFFHKIPPVKVLVFGYMFIILCGTLFLMLPVSSKSGESTAFINSLFTACSATCVTGLTVFDTFTHWTVFGQLVILCLIQIGGLGFMSLAIVIVTFTGKRIGYGQRVLMRESISAPQVGGVVRMARFVISSVLLFELLGAALLSITFIPNAGFKSGIYYSIYHSVSAFCNAGFDVLGKYGKGSSLVHFNNNPILLLTICALIIFGGLGFYVWNDVRENRLHWRHYKLHSKIVLTTTAFLIVSGTFMFFVLEYNSKAFQPLSFGEKILNSFFMSVTPRTAGFASIDMLKATEPSLFITMALMLVGGSPGSTAGGIKTTTAAVFAANTLSISKRNSSVKLFRRRIDDVVLKSAAAIVFIYIVLTAASATIISAVDGFPILESLFEAASAIGTVGLTIGVSENAGVITKVILMFLMYFGRVGCLTILYAIRKKSGPELSRLPLEKIAVG